MIVEVCVDSLESAIIAKKAGADQVELVSESSIGGLTPSLGMTELVLKNVIKTMVMVRPRAAGFNYSDYDKEVMLADVKLFKEIGAQGVVFGSLNADSTIDYEFTKRIVEAAGDMEIVFHRAFEVVKDKVSAAKKLKKCGVTRILTKGGNSLIDGADIIREILKENDRPEIISGGIRPNTVELAKDLGLKYVHVSSSRNFTDTSTSGTGIYFGRENSPNDEIYTIADLEYLTNIINMIKSK